MDHGRNDLGGKPNYITAVFGLRGCKNRPAPFAGRMLYKAAKPGLVLFYILACCNCIVVNFRCYVFCLLVVLVKLSLLAK